jgi:uncharacterized protein (TIGR03118 family)
MMKQPVSHGRIPRRPPKPLLLERLEGRRLLSGYEQLNLVGYQPGMAPTTDPNLNGWGMDFAPDGPLCVADTLPGVATFYDRLGHVLSQKVTIPKGRSSFGGPQGLVYNPTSDFVISENGRSGPAVFLFATGDGTISGWNPTVDPDHAILMVDNSTETPHPADYTGLVIAQNSHGQNVLYAADFGDFGVGNSGSNNRIDMFDGSFHSLGSFTDPDVASRYPGYRAWQVEEVDGQLWVTFATDAAPFGGVVDIFDTDGDLLTPNHFAANAGGAGPLEDPWGIVQAPANFGDFSNDVLIGNVEGAGNINAFDPITGAFLSPLRHPDGTPIAIAGLWDLVFGGSSPNNGKSNQLFFDAGPSAENLTGNGLFGMITVPGDADSFALSAPPTAVAGMPFELTVTALDPFGNIATGYTGTVSFVSSDPKATLPVDYTFTAADNGTHTFPGVTLFTAGVQTLTAQDTTEGSLTGSATVALTAAPADHFLITTSPTAVSGTAFDVMLAALDPYGNVDLNYQGTVAWSSSDRDPGVVLPADYTFQVTDNGVATFPAGVTLITPGDQTVTVSDTANGITGSATLAVGAPPGGGARRPTIPSTNTARGAQIVSECPCVDRLFASLQKRRLLWVRRKHDGAAEDLFEVEGGMLD